MAETQTEIQVRLVLERQCRALAEDLGRKVPAGVGFILFLCDFGNDGNLAYVSSVERDGAIKLVQEWLDHQDDNYDVKTLRELLVAGGDLLLTVAKAVGFPGELSDPQALVAHCERLRIRADSGGQ